MIRRVCDLSDSHIRDRRTVTITGTLVGTWTSSRGPHVVSVEVAGDAPVEIGEKG